MKKYKKEIDGKVEVKALKDIVLNKDGSMVFNPTEEMVLADGWTEHVFKPREWPMEIQLQRVKDRKLRELERYDESKEVNDCIIVYQGEEIAGNYESLPVARKDLVLPTNEGKTETFDAENFQDFHLSTSLLLVQSIGFFSFLQFSFSFLFSCL